MPLLETEAIVINSLKLGEADKLVTFYSFKLGKIKAVARGARKIKNKFGSALEPFTHNRLIIYDKKPRVLYRIFQSDIIESFQSLRADYDKILYASHFCRFVETFSPEGDPSPPVFSLFLQLFGYLRNFKGSPGLVNLFKVKLIGYAGYQMNLEHCVRCKRSDPAAGFSPISGGLVCTACLPSNAGYSFPVSMAAQAFLRQAFKMEPAVISRLKPADEVLKEISHILEVYVFHILGKKFPSI